MWQVGNASASDWACLQSLDAGNWYDAGKGLSCFLRSVPTLYSFLSEWRLCCRAGVVISIAEPDNFWIIDKMQKRLNVKICKADVKAGELVRSA